MEDKLVKGIESVTILEYNSGYESKKQFLSWHQECCPYKPTEKQLKLANKIKEHLGHDDVKLNTMTQVYLYVNRFKDVYNNSPSVKQKYYLKIIAYSKENPEKEYEKYLKFTRKDASKFIKDNIDGAKRIHDKREKEIDRVIYNESYNYPNAFDMQIWEL